MLARLRKSMDEKDEGFTLIELLVVVIIIGILAAIAIPVFLNQRKKGYDAQAKSDVRNLATKEETFLTDNNAYGTATQVNTADPIRLAPNVTVKVFTNTGGFCLVGNHLSSDKWWVYDSARGGIQATAQTSQATADAVCTGATTPYTAAGQATASAAGVITVS